MFFFFFQNNNNNNNNYIKKKAAPAINPKQHTPPITPPIIGPLSIIFFRNLKKIC